MAVMSLVQNAIERGNLTELRSLLESEPARARVNMERSAIQVGNCQGRIVGHYPISGELLTRLMSPRAGS
jgi:hypothetical protein